MCCYERLILLFLLIITSSTIFTPVEGNCEFNINHEDPNEPILLKPVYRSSKTTYELIVMDECSVKLHPNQNLLLSCPGKGNYLNITQEDNWATVTCVCNDKLKIGKEHVLYGSLTCSKRPQATLRVTNKPCFRNRGVIINLGFEAKENWYPLLEVCHDVQKSITYFVKHTLNLPPAGCPKTPSKRPNFLEGYSGLYLGLDVNRLYTTRNQLVLIEERIGVNNVTDFIDKDKNKYLARGHLAPDADFQMDSWQTLTYFYINVAPQWQSINGGSWLCLENQVRKLAAHVKQLKVITGTHGILKIAGKNFHLGDETIPVPEYFWKLIHNPDDNSCMGFISRNDPFMKRKPNEICPNVCSRYGWEFTNSIMFYGYIYCCEYHQLRKAIQEVPAITCRKAARSFD